MNPPQRFGALLLLLLAPAFSPQVRAQCTAHPTDAGAQFLGSFTVTVTITIDPGPPLSVCQVPLDICTWLTSNNQVDYVLNVGSMTFSGDCGVVDGMSLQSLLDMAALEAVKKGTTLDYTECGDTTEVLVGQCAERSGSGAGTTFEPCNTLWCKRRYVIVCGPTETSYRQLVEEPVVCTGASTGCEAGCAATQ